jgi:hypothetical protein
MKNITIFKIFLISIILLSSNYVRASKWSEWKEISNQSIPLNFISIDNLIGNSNFSGWITEAKLQGGKAKQYWIESYFSEGFILIDYIKFPPAWVITGSENDRKYIISKAGNLLGLERKNNPIKNISKKDIERYRDIENNVTPYVYFQFDNQECVIFNKGYYKRESGYIQSVEDDETLTVLFCKYSGLIENDFVHKLIDSIQLR